MSYTVLNCLDRVTQKHPYVGVILCGDFNQLNDRFIVSYPLKQIVSLATRRNNILDKIYTNIADYYDVPCIIIHKLVSLGVSSVLVRWVCSFLSDRQQRVKISDFVSDWLTVKGGMPQGSYLGPRIFLVLIYDLFAGCLLHKFNLSTTQHSLKSFQKGLPVIWTIVV